MINEKGENILLFCDDPDCFAIHIAEKNYIGEKTQKGKITEKGK